MMRLTKRVRRYQARAVKVGHSQRRGRRWFAVPVAALLLSLLTVTAPALTRAPLEAGVERAHLQPTLIDQRIGAWATPGTATPAAPDERVAGPYAPLPAAEPDPALDARYQAALDAALGAGKAYGATFAVVRDGALIWTGSSGRAADGTTALEPGSGFVIGSVTKTFVAAAVLQLVAEGRVNLGEPIGRYLPEVASVSGEVTVAQLLDHTSGLADVFNDTTRRGLEDEPERAWSTGEILASVREPWYEPGEGWAYANTNYYLLGMLVERRTGASLADELSRRFLAPLALDRTRLLTGAAGEPLEPAWATIFWASGAMTSTAADLARWGDALYAGSVLDARSRAIMLRFNGHDHGLGVQRLELDELTGYGHTGLLDTYTTIVFHAPSQRVTLALLVNRSRVDLEAMLTAEPENGPSLLQLAIGTTD